MSKRPTNNSQTLSSDNYLTDKEHTQLLKNLSRLLDLTQKDQRNATLILTALHTGARAMEVLNLRSRDLNPQKQTLLIRGLKGSYNRELPIPESLVQLLQSQISTNPRQPKIFNLSYHRMWEIWHSINPTTKKLHALRHTKAMRTLERTKDPSTVMFGLGHKSFTSTQVYITHAISEQRAKAFLED